MYMRDCKVLLMQKDSIAKCCLAFFKSKLGHQTLLKKINKKKIKLKTQLTKKILVIIICLLTRPGLVNKLNWIFVSSSHNKFSCLTAVVLIPQSLMNSAKGLLAVVQLIWNIYKQQCEVMSSASSNTLIATDWTCFQIVQLSYFPQIWSDACLCLSRPEVEWTVVFKLVNTQCSIKLFNKQHNGCDILSSSYWAVVKPSSYGIFTPNILSRSHYTVVCWHSEEGQWKYVQLSYMSSTIFFQDLPCI